MWYNIIKLLIQNMLGFRGFMKNLDGKKILIGVTGGVAAYKICSLIGSLLKLKAEVRVVMTDSATKFVTPLTFQALTNHPVYTNLWNPTNLNTVEHISIAHWPNIIVIAPATANSIAKIVHGFADNLLTTIVLAKKPETKMIVAPTMNTFMWNNSITKSNIELLKKINNTHIVEPRSGTLACRDEGTGKIAENETIIEEIKKSIT
jgi:phosphopantothenoylcysteine decarboxylase/phosphopantothenate--cysteine ligase